jgi:hypothetical protein
VENTTVHLDCLVLVVSCLMFASAVWRLREQEAVLTGEGPGRNADMAFVPVIAFGELQTGWVGIAVIAIILVLRLVSLMRRRQR